MNEQYPIGAICIGQNMIVATEYNGMECEIIGGLKMRRGILHGRLVPESLKYDVRWADGRETFQEPQYLRRKPPKHKEWAEGKVREITQDSVHVGGGSKHLIPEEAA